MCRKYFNIVLILLLTLSTSIVFAESEALTFSRKIGPLLRKTIIKSKAETINKSMQMPSGEKDLPSADLLKVIVVINRNHLKPLQADLINELKFRVEELGGYIGDHAYNNVQVWISIEQIEKLAEWSEIKLIKTPLKPKINSIISEGVDVTGAKNWHNHNLKGTNVKIGVIDIGFKGYSSLLGTELPLNLKTNFLGSYSEFTSDPHGTACAEIVYDIAPEGDLYLVNATDMDVGFHNATSWLMSQGVKVISSSIALSLLYINKIIYELLHTWTDPDYILAQLLYLEEVEDQLNNTTNLIVSQGTAWSQSAGNYGNQNWRNDFTDWDGNYYLNFSHNENYNEIEFPSDFQYGEEVYVAMRWGFETDFETYDDYDLYITNSLGYTVASSTINQGILPLAMESCKFTPIPGVEYYVWVKQYWAIPQEIGLLLGVGSLSQFKYFHPRKTIVLSSPASNPNIITVGAVPFYDPYKIEPFSSQGPTADGHIKPDLVAPDRVSTASYGPTSFSGTSAAAPHVAGVCALVKQAYPNWSPFQVKNFLESNAIDLGIPGKDNVYGSGLVFLPEIKIDPTHPSTAMPWIPLLLLDD